MYKIQTTHKTELHKHISLGFVLFSRNGVTFVQFAFCKILALDSKQYIRFTQFLVALFSTRPYRKKWLFYFAFSSGKQSNFCIYAMAFTFQSKKKNHTEFLEFVVYERSFTLIQKANTFVLITRQTKTAAEGLVYQLNIP